MFMFANRMKQFHTSVFTELIEEKNEYEKRTGEKVIDFSLGSPTIPPTKEIMETMEKAVSVPANYRYAVNPLPEMLEAVKVWYQQRYGAEIDTDQIVLLQGSQEALINLPLIFCNPGDVILVQDPYYPVYTDAPRLAEAKVEYMPLKAENDFLIDLDAIPEETRKAAKMMIVCYPNNPTGAVAPDSFVEKLIRFARENQIMVLYDNAYSDLVFDGKPGRSFLSYPGAEEVGVEINSFSKSYGMAGARLGVLIGNRQVIDEYRVLKSNMDYGVFLPVQKAGIAALQSGFSLVEETKDKYEARRNLLIESFGNAGWQLPTPPATMFVWAPVPAEYPSAKEFCRMLLRKAGVLVTPGTAFGEAGQHYVRIAFVASEEDILEAGRRIAASGLFQTE